ncbi:septal ring lytic transglycosylase RlpA family protein [Motilimonas eburnea]|uniref:septal ring lytic transglycosylase RlpA family protein n=1 Tax=Motilimonas eburnea TaxID=1737488 RepID=UPI001E365CBF|nr:septal ring lytic transglycosylase RlpA family protein [Motilimonas eburnea]MCE2572525.1 septal ring lytic transglycosylase RlpA family protein [Motilimonas eburnea]
MPHLIKATLFVAFSLALSACSSTPSGKEANWRGFTQSGQASYYADKYNNRKTASGEIYHHKYSTAAHRELPFGAKVKVTNVKNGKTVVVKINDRGPFIRGRIIDLSKSAFSRIGNTSEGLLDVTIQVID